MNSKGCLQELVQEDHRKGKIFDISQERVFSEWSKSVTGSLTEWEYIGSINGYHVIRTSIEGDTWRNYSLTIVKVLENGITTTATIDGLKRCEVLSAEIKGDHLLYSQMTTGYGFFYEVTNAYPQLGTLLPEICGELESEKNMSIGFFTFESQIDAEGKLSSKKIISFTPCEGWPPYSGKEYPLQELKKHLLQLCR